MEALYKIQTRYIFHSNVKIKIPDEYDESVFDDLYGILEETDRKFNSYSPFSDITEINKNSGNFTDVDKETVEMLKKVIYYSDLLDGEYDITIMPLIKLWGFYKEEGAEIPSREDMEKTKKLVDYRKIKIDTEEKK